MECHLSSASQNPPILVARGCRLSQRCSLVAGAGSPVQSVPCAPKQRSEASRSPNEQVGEEKQSKTRFPNPSSTEPRHGSREFC